MSKLDIYQKISNSCLLSGSKRSANKEGDRASAENYCKGEGRM